MHDKEMQLYLDAAMLAQEEVSTHIDWPTESLAVLRRVVFRAFLEGAEYAKDNPQSTA